MSHRMLSESVLMSASFLNNRAIELLSVGRYIDGLTLLKQSMDIIMNQIDFDHAMRDDNSSGSNNERKRPRVQPTYDQSAEINATCRRMSELRSFNDFIVIEEAAKEVSDTARCFNGSSTSESRYPKELVGVIVLYNTALILWETNQIVEAREVFKLALDLIDEEDKLQTLHASFVISVLYHLAEATMILGDFEGAMLFYVEAIEIGSSQLPGSFLVAAICSRTGGLLMETGYVEAAEALYAKTVSLYNSQKNILQTNETLDHTAAAA